jgi:NitT/TauT family transport system substrate-binding protein
VTSPDAAPNAQPDHEAATAGEGRTAMRRRWTPLVLAALMLLAPALALAQMKPRDKATFQFAWIPYGKYAGFYMAKELGYYEEAGLDLTFIRGYGMQEAVAKLVSGAADLAR